MIDAAYLIWMHEDNYIKELRDYKLMCFNGQAEYTFVCTDRYSSTGLKVTIFDKKWNKLPVKRSYPESNELIKKPQNYDLMVKLAEELSKNIPFMRIDFYECNRKLYFGELTFYPGSGFEKFYPEEWDLKLGNLINLHNHY